MPCPVSLDDPDAPEPQEVTKGAYRAVALVQTLDEHIPQK